jgi:homoserine O-acetyltransferase/O-succinyltransferase
MAGIKAKVLTINSTDDERNPRELGTIDNAVARLKNAEAFWIEGGANTDGHATVLNAKLWADKLAKFLSQ